MAVTTEVEAPEPRRPPPVGRLVEWGCLLTLAAGFFVVGPRHAPWFDEAQSWLLARDSSPLQIAAHWARYEGSPALWQCVLWVFQRAGGRYEQLWMVGATLALTGSALLVFASPFPLWMRASLPFTYFFGYQYALVARSYALDLALVPLVASLLPARSRRPVAYGLALALTANSNAFGFVIAGVMTLELAARARGRSGGPMHLALAISGCGLLLAILQVWPAPALECRCGWSPSFSRPTIIVGAAFVQQLWPGAAGLRLAILGGTGLTVMLAPPMVALFVRAGLGWLAAGLIGLSVLLAGLVQTQFHHAGMILLATLLALWLSWPAADRLPRDMRLWLSGSMALLIAYQAVDTLGAWRQEVQGPPYCAARGVAAWLTAHGAPSRAATLGGLGSSVFALQPYFPHNVIANAGRPADPAFYRWSPDEAVGVEPDLRDWAKLLQGGRFAWLVAPDLREPEQRALFDAARRAGYVPVARFPAQAIWKSRRIWMTPLAADDGLQIFVRAPHPDPRPKAALQPAGWPASHRGDLSRSS